MRIEKEVTFDSFLITDENKNEQIVKVKLHKQKDPYVKRIKVVRADRDNDKAFLNKETHCVIRESKDYYRRQQAQLDKDLHKIPNYNRDHKKYILYRKANKYKKRTGDFRHKAYRKESTTRWLVDGSLGITISKSTLKKLRKTLGQSGLNKCSIKIDFDSSWDGSVGYGHSAKFIIYDENILNNVYFYNTLTKNKISIGNYINIANLTDNKDITEDRTTFINTQDKLAELDIIIVTSERHTCIRFETGWNN